MRDKPRCTHLTTRGRPCRNPATPGSEPPACAVHGRRPATGPTNSEHPYLPRPTTADQRVLATTVGEPDLRPEIDLARVVLRRLMAHLEESAGELPPEELRRVAGLIFTGARTVAMLIGKRPARSDDPQQWLAAALAEMGEKYGREL